MSFVKCAACPAIDQCIEAGQCLNTVVILHNYTQRTAHRAGTGWVADAQARQADRIAAHAAASHEVTPARPPAGPPSAPRAGGVAATINAACEVALAALGVVNDATLKQAARDALPGLLAAGVNENSARKGVGVWARTRK